MPFSSLNNIVIGSAVGAATVFAAFWYYRPKTRSKLLAQQQLASPDEEDLQALPDQAETIHTPEAMMAESASNDGSLSVEKPGSEAGSNDDPSSLPDGIWLNIFDHLDLVVKIRLRRVSRRWSEVLARSVRRLDLRRFYMFHAPSMFGFLVPWCGPYLQELYGNCQLDLKDDDVELLQKCAPNVRLLDVFRMRLSGISKLGRLEVLRVKGLVVGDLPFDQEDLDVMSCLRRLEILEIEGLAELHRKLLTNLHCAGLKVISISGGSYVTSDVLERFAENCQCIEDLCIFDGAFTSLEPLLKLKYLKKLTVWACKHMTGQIQGKYSSPIESLVIGDSELKSLEFLRHLHHLGDLHIWEYASGLPALELAHFPREAPLKVLKLELESFPFDGLAGVLANLRYPIEVLILGRCSWRYDVEGVTLPAATSMMRSIPTLRDVRFYGDGLDDSIFDTVAQYGQNLTELGMDSRLVTQAGILELLAQRKRSIEAGSLVADLILIIGTQLEHDNISSSLLKAAKVSLYW